MILQANVPKDKFWTRSHKVHGFESHCSQDFLLLMFSLFSTLTTASYECDMNKRTGETEAPNGDFNLIYTVQ